LNDVISETPSSPASIASSPCAKLTILRAAKITLMASAISAYTLPIAVPAIEA
jgi:hypothetical protein